MCTHYIQEDDELNDEQTQWQNVPGGSDKTLNWHKSGEKTSIFFSMNCLLPFSQQVNLEDGK